MKGIEGFTNKPAKHFKCTVKKASLELWHIQIGTLTHYAYILLVVNVQSSLVVEKKRPAVKLGEKT